MAEVDFDHFDGGYAVSPHGFGRWLNLGGAALSVAIILGAGVWGYQLAMRDVSGIPVIRAMGGPLRIAPANPGGEEAQHQGLSVNAVAAAGTALPIPDTLRLAPRPMALLEEDTAGLALPEGVEGAEVSSLADTSPASGQLDAAQLPEVLPETQQDAVALALAEALGETPVAESSAVVSGEVVASPRPRQRGAAVADGSGEAAPPVVTEIAAENVAPGSRLVQLGAFDDQDAARAEWARMVGRFGDLMAGKSMVVQSAQSGGRTFYRLRAYGFADEDEARRFCTAMLAENATCIPVAHR